MTDHDPDEEGRRFRAAAYRTTRAILQCKHLLPTGKSLQEAFSHDNRVFDNRQAVDPTSTLGALSDLRVPTLLPEDPSHEQVAQMALLHGYAAIQIGYEPSDPCLHWFQADLLQEFLPTATQLLAFEDRFLRRLEKPLARGGKQAALKRLESILGPASSYERRDWAGLPLSRLRDLASSSTEDDRVLMQARLERLIIQAEEALDTRAALSALRQLSAVQGLTFLDNDKNRRELMHLLSQTAPVRSLEQATLPPPAE